MKTAILTIAIGLALATAASAADEKTIEAGVGGHIKMNDGTIYQTDDDVSNWQRGDTVIVPDNGDTLINSSQGNEEVSADEQ